MNVSRALSGAGLVAALAVAGWYVLGQSAAPGLSALLLVGLALGSPTAWLLVGFAGVGAVVLWKAYGAKIGEGESG